MRYARGVAGGILSPVELTALIVIFHAGDRGLFVFWRGQCDNVNEFVSLEFFTELHADITVDGPVTIHLCDPNVPLLSDVSFGNIPLEAGWLPSSVTDLATWSAGSSWDSGEQCPAPIWVPPGSYLTIRSDGDTLYTAAQLYEPLDVLHTGTSGGGDPGGGGEGFPFTFPFQLE